ncbi:putative bifunctional diguanylate cyclase/phosphodiesterase [Clostridium paraputrificum]|uniref:putative bifunctional diguanylate cyclase/phosphodiesterase n=1 Tax=Clostridium paraputrificum TaxID=29363 RepID=UPI003D32B025
MLDDLGYRKNINIFSELLFIILSLIAFLFRINQINFVFGITFNLSSIFLLIIFSVWGFRRSLIVSILIYTVSIFFDVSPSSIYIIIEIIFIGIFDRYNKTIDLIVKDLLFWLIVGVPIYLVVNNISLRNLNNEYTLFLILKDTTNAVINAVIAELVVTYIPIRRWLGKKYEIYFKDCIFHTLIVIIVFPFVYNFFISTLKAYEWMNENDNFHFNNYIDIVYREGVEQFRLILLFSVIALCIIFLINKKIFRSLRNLAKSTRGMVEEINLLDRIDWPNSNVVEINSLINNYKEVAFSLRDKLLESKSLNKKLENQTKELILSKKKLHKQAYYDILTDLPNRFNFMEQLEGIANIKDIENKVAIIFFDINRFKQINDTLGHDTGDRLLFLIAERMRSIVSDKTYVYRLGGDEFVVVATIKEDTEARILGDSIIEILKDRFIIDKKEIEVTASMGVSIYPDDGEDINSIVKYADIAMYKSKENGGGYLEVFNEETKKVFTEKHKIEKEIINAIKNNEFTLYYQPKVNCDTEEIVSLEALVRWRNKELGEIKPSVFIPIAEERNLIASIDRFALLKSCEKIRELRDKDNINMQISVNISPKHFVEGELLVEVKEALSKHNVPSKYLKIEITEGMIIKNLDIAIKIINELNTIGVKVCMDDFGSGFSSFNQLINLPIDELKIDRKFVKGVNKNNKKGMVARLIVELAHGLKLNVVGEGVETKEEASYLKLIGCNQLQGFLYGKPMGDDELDNYLQKQIR